MIVRPARGGTESEGAGLPGPEILVVQGLAGLASLVGFGALVLLLALDLQWRDGELFRLIGLLWAVPVAVLMTERHAFRTKSFPADERYLHRARLARWAGLLLVIVALPVFQWRVLEGRPDWMNTDEAMPLALSVALCLVVDAVAHRWARIWKLLQVQRWEEAGRDTPPTRAALYESWHRVDRTLLLRDLWRLWFIGGLVIGASVLGRQSLTAGQNLLPWGIMALIAYLFLGPLLIGQEVQVHWRAQWHLDALRDAAQVPAAWGRLAATLTLAGLATLGLLVASGLFDAAHRGLLRLGALLHLPSLAGHPVAALPPAPQSTGPSAAAGGAGGPIQAGGSSFSLDLHLGTPGLTVLVLGALALLAWSLVWVRRRESYGGVNRWLVLAALAIELGAYLRWLGNALIRLRPGKWREALSPIARAVAAPAAAPSRPARPPDLGPRQALIDLYVRVTTLAARHGVPRQPGQTPREHAEMLGARLRTGNRIPVELAEGFAAARYGLEPVEKERVDRLRGHWAALRKALRRGTRTA